MTEDINSFYFKNIVRRFNTNFPVSVCNRIHTVSFIKDPMSFYKFIYCADVILDPFPFGGLISTFDIFSCGRAIITLPGEKLYGRFTAGLYKLMGLNSNLYSHVVAQTEDDYVTKAITIASIPHIREKIEEKYLK
jgi:predicted O-linked N-acetylglucosamine transferase (SPINDLY family)